MGVGTLTIYNASAGSGKTHQLAGIYLEKLFKSRLSYRKILAVTFTHKATAEMKSRILEELNKLSTGESSGYLNDLIAATGKPEEAVRKEAGEILYSILHDYSRFSVSTIDSFYQKILRAFARDIGLHSGFDIEIDHTDILDEAIENMIASAADDLTVRNWLLMFTRANIEEEKTWDLRKSIAGLAGELFSEKFRLLNPKEKQKLYDKESLKGFISEMRLITSSFKKDLREMGGICQDLIEKYSLSDDMFFQKGKGIPGYIRAVAGGEIKAPNSYVRGALGSPPRWSSGEVPAALAKAIGAGLDKSLRELVKYFDDNVVIYNTADVILSNIYILGILSDVLNEVRLITSNENVFLLSDAGELIYLITEKDQTPFIYEKVGNVYENIMIDEFQDTSVIQWRNFSHLIDNSMAQGFDNLVVGDIKQSIYRWRNSDWKTLRDLRKKVDNERYLTMPLSTNYRSRSNIIKFNNTLFTVIPNLIDSELSENISSFTFSELFSEAVQIDPGFKKEGYVRIEFVENSDEFSWKEEVLKRLPSVIESIEDKGYHASDIGILVRDNKEGALILQEIISYSGSCPVEKQRKYNYNIVSGESLLLANSPVVNFIIAVLTVLDNPDNMIGRALMLRYFLLSTGKSDVTDVPLVAEELTEFSAGFYPKNYSDFLSSIRYLPLWNITEKIIGFFGLGDYSFNVGYLSSFQDLIINHSSARNPGIPSFLEWWSSQGINKSILVPEQQDSIKVLTIHKAKGLEFGIVILPFVSWNLDHKVFHSNILWVEPGRSPFNKLGIVPVRYKGALTETIFSDQYLEEKYSAYLDNINLLYVAFTRAVDAIIGFAPAQPRVENRIAAVVREAITFEGDLPDGSKSFLNSHFDTEKGIFEYGELNQSHKTAETRAGVKIDNYPVIENSRALKLKLHWEDYFSTDKSGIRERINHGKIMHEIFSEILTADDVQKAVNKKIIEGKITEEDGMIVSQRIKDLLCKPVVSKWFEKGNKVLNEASVLLPDSSSRRPDRIIMRDSKVIIVDFKFGEESQNHLNQVSNYRMILKEMGYEVSEAYIWYVDIDKIVAV